MQEQQQIITILFGSINAILLYTVAYFLKQSVERNEKVHDEIFDKMDNHESRITVVETKIDKK